MPNVLHHGKRHLILGLVSNCWHRQLDKGEPLEALIAQAVDVGFRAVELRQTCLGEYENSAHCPISEKLERLPVRFPSIRFNIAICVPFMNSEMSVNDHLFNAGKTAARAVAGRFEAHLRLVDLMTTSECDNLTSPLEIGKSIAKLTESCVRDNVQLSVENSRQSWAVFRSAFIRARERLGKLAGQLQICFDPCNLLLPDDDVDPGRVAMSLDKEEVSMIHFKQRRAGSSCDSVCDGSIDWAKIIAVINEKNLSCQGMLEIDSSEWIWDRLVSSHKFLQSLGLVTSDDVE